jgi:hypothetical protein
VQARADSSRVCWARGILDGCAPSSYDPRPLSHSPSSSDGPPRSSKQEHINTGKGEAAAIEARAAATASAIRNVAAAIQSNGGHEASAYRVAEQYIHAFGGLAQGSNTLVVPANTADVGSMVAQAMSIYRGLTPDAAAARASTAANGADGVCPPCNVCDVCNVCNVGDGVESARYRIAAHVHSSRDATCDVPLATPALHPRHVALLPAHHRLPITTTDHYRYGRRGGQHECAERLLG